ncbi:MAG: response regulator transcription factor [Flavisolibacter sp.]
MEPIGISIVEDLEEIRTSLEKTIREASDFLLLSSHNDGEQACADLPKYSPDIVLMDINLPGMNGIDCIKKIKAQCPKTQFMMFTIYEDSEQVFEALSVGANGYLLKKTRPEQILDALKELYKGGAPMTASIARRVVNSFQKTAAINNETAVLSKRENEILQLLSKGLLYKEISQKLGITFGTVRQHIHNIYEKLHVQNKTEAINKAYGKW